MKFSEWFDKCLTVGPFPIRQNQWFDATKYDIVINVSDEFYFDTDLLIQSAAVKTFWFPMSEQKKDVGLASIYGAMVVLWNAEREKKRVYLNCHAGKNRSRAVQAAYYFLRTGQQLEVNEGGFVNRLCAMCARGYLPPKSEMEDFLTLLGKQLENFKGEPMGGLLDEVKIETIRNF